MKIVYLTSSNSYYPVCQVYGTVNINGQIHEIVDSTNKIKWDLGNNITVLVPPIETVFPIKITLFYILETSFVKIKCIVSINENEVIYNVSNNEIPSTFIFGANPNGRIDVWHGGYKRLYLIKSVKNNNILADNEYSKLEKLIQQYTYRYIIKSFIKEQINIEDEKSIIFDYIEETLYDGTYDKLHDDRLLKYHEAGKPKKLAIKWHIKKTEYTAYFWFDEMLICEIFEKLYGAHRDTKVDFIIQIDAEQKKYELSLYRYGLKEPLIIPEEAYQLLVFKSKFEHYRSDNYNQERGAWIW
ncbi:hypothetical protein [Phocaeicola sp.]